MTDYVAALGNARHVFHAEAVRLAEWLRNGSHVSAGVLRWESNGRVPSADAIALAAHLGLAVDAAACDAARDADTSAFLAEYRRTYSGPSDEERAEARAAHGAGVELVNVITGHRWRT